MVEYDRAPLWGMSHGPNPSAAVFSLQLGGEFGPGFIPLSTAPCVPSAHFGFTGLALRSLKVKIPVNLEHSVKAFAVKQWSEFIIPMSFSEESYVRLEHIYFNLIFTHYDHHV
ncbi:hypothetical protein R1flu_018391 [Riccia fluitans]|uniref:Uncharacterized protein n=1 Tax=Riccia fluitans TaxID=41844 RepID=A0ABD1ZFQ2_9MARC